MKLEYRLTLAELIESDWGWGRPESIIYLIIFDSILIAIYLICARLSEGELYFQAMLVPTLLFYVCAVIAAILLFYLSRLSRYFTLKKDWQRRMRSGHTCDIEISNEGFIDNATPPAIFSWSMFDYWRETSNLFLLYDAGGSCVIFPKRVFDSEQIHEFRAILSAHLLKRKRMKIKW
jgi:hypothetical protein